MFKLECTSEFPYYIFPEAFRIEFKVFNICAEIADFTLLTALTDEIDAVQTIR